MFQPKITEINRDFNDNFLFFDWWINRLFFKKKKLQKLLSKFFRFSFSKINRISTEFFSNIKKFSKLFKKNFLNYFFSKNFLYGNFFLQIFFLVKIFIIEFFFAKIFLFTKIFLRRFFSQYFTTHKICN